MQFLSHKNIRLLIERTDSEGKPIPFSFVYAAQNGDIVRGTNAIVTSPIPDKKSHRVQFTEENGTVSHKTLCDCLFMQVNNIEIE